jgi:hypothetical protein
LEQRFRLARERPTREVRRRFLLVCEGKVTEPDYFRPFSRSRLADVDVEVVGAGAVPVTLLAKAIELFDGCQRDAKPDEVWLVFDRDQHLRVREVLQSARAKGFRVALSVPSVELWLLLHFRRQSRHFERDEALRAVERELPGYDKHLSDEQFGQLANKFGTAVSNAEGLLKAVTRDGDPLKNPHTTFPHLVRSLLVAMDRFRGSGPAARRCREAPSVRESALEKMIAVVRKSTG